MNWNGIRTCNTGTRWVALTVCCFGIGGCGGPAGPPKPDRAPQSALRNTELESNATPTPSSAPSPIQFIDHAVKSGVNHVYEQRNTSSHASILNSLGGGCGVFDFDRDRQLDLVFTGGGQFGMQQQILGLPTAVFRNVGPWRYQTVSEEMRITTARHFSHGVAIADQDHDGFEDILVTGFGGVQLWQNLGDGTFHDVTDAALLNDTLWSTSAAWGDFNGDHHLDLYLAHYVDWSFQNHPYCPSPTPGVREVCSPKAFNPLPDTIYYSHGDGTFEDASASAGLRQDGKGLGVVAADVDLDGKLDVYVGNDTVPNFLYHNLGSGRFEEIAELSGTALGDRSSPDGSMGVAVGDFNLDGLPDIWVANYENESFALYRNDGNCTFLHVSQPLGVTATGSLFVGFGTVFFDGDRDGDEDLWVSNGHVILYPENAPIKQLPLIFENQASRWFQNVAPDAGEYCRTPHQGRGTAKGDLDGDGDLDLVTTHIVEPAALLENRSESKNGWIQVQLIGTRSNRSAIGSLLTLKTSNGKYIRQITGGGSYLSHSDLRAFWGVPVDAILEELTIQWPSGTKQVIAKPAVNRTHVLIEPSE